MQKSMMQREREWRRLYPEAFARGTKVNREKKKKTSRCNWHHMSNKCQGFGGTLQNGGDNLLRMDRQRHAKLHQLFKNMSWEEIHNTLNEIFGVGAPELVVHVMARVARMKKRHR